MTPPPNTTPRPAAQRAMIAKAAANDRDYAVSLAKSAILQMDLGDTAAAQHLLRNLIKQLTPGHRA